MQNNKDIFPDINLIPMVFESIKKPGVGSLLNSALKRELSYTKLKSKWFCMSENIKENCYFR